MNVQKKSVSLSKLGRAALWYAIERGWRVFPLHSVSGVGCSCGSSSCGGAGKHPRTERGCLDATTDTAAIQSWWERWPDANVGIATGAGLVVIDVDPRHGGDDTLVDLVRALGAIPDTVEALTGGGGRHIYLASETPVRNSAALLGPGIDVRGDGGYVVAAPSTHESGRVYGWEVSSRPEAVEVASVPAAWLDAMVRKPKLRALPGGQGEPIAAGARNDTLYRRACSMRSFGDDEATILAQLLSLNELRCQPPLDPAEVKKIVHSACKHEAGLSPEYQAAKDHAVRCVDAAEGGVTNETGDWMADLFRTPRGAVRNSFANLCAILRFASEYGAALRYDEMNLTPMLDGAAVSDAALGAVRERIERTYGIAPSADAISAALLTVSYERRYHPVQDYLNGLVWDDTERLATVAARILHADATPINATMLRAWFISAVARALRPGCKVDTALVLVGPQGVQKSGFFRVLGGKWFSDTAINLDSKDAFQQLRAAWIYEWGEIEQITGRAHAGKVKAFVTSQVDSFRPPFARTIAAYDRANVIVGSTNEDQFLNDATGSRRFWVVRVNGQINLEALAAERDQLWAEAVHAFRAGDPWWLSGEAEGLRSESSEDFRVSDPWEEAVSAWIDTRVPDSAKTYTTRQILTTALAVRVEDQTQAAANRVAAIMKKLGFRNKVAKLDGKAQRIWEVLK